MRLDISDFEEPVLFVLLSKPSTMCIVLSMNSIKFGDRNSGAQVGINNEVMNLGAGKSLTMLVLGSDLID